MKKLLSVLMLSVLPLMANAGDNIYLIDNHQVYQISQGKAYKVEVVDNTWYTTNLWFPLSEKGCTDEYVRQHKKDQITYANKSLKKIKGY